MSIERRATRYASDEESQRATILTINGKAAVVMQDPEGHETLVDLKEWSETIEVLRGRLASLSRKKGRTADDFFIEFFASNNILTED